jgi:DNA topoisomerase I
VLYPLAKDKAFRRVTYNEITKAAVLKAVSDPRDIDEALVDAQQARRILDRLVGYKVSPLLWKYVQCANNRSLSAGRVQSVALRLLVERQREIDEFKPETYYLMGAEAKKGSQTFIAKLAKVDGKKTVVNSIQMADGFLLDLASATLETVELKTQPKVRHAYPPFTTSTLQQAASSVLSFSPGKTMKLAQALYEDGLITYMRTDSVMISKEAAAAAKDFIVANIGEKYYPEVPNKFKSKESAQGAHEAIRPTDVLLTPSKAKLEASAAKLYDLIWRRFIASQMADAQTLLKTAVFAAKKPGIVHDYEFTASATEILFDGFLKVMNVSSKKKKSDDDDQSDEVSQLPELVKGEELEVVRWIADEKQTKGPKNYSEASLIKALEENGVGRPSTYAATIETLKLREYAQTEKTKIYPLKRGILVCDWLVKKLDSLFNVGYTAEMEAELDKVESNKESMNAMLSQFYVKFLKSLAECSEPAPDRAKFDAVFEMLSEISVWKEAKKVGKRVYDDKAFVESVKSQYDSNKPLSSKQLEFLVKMIMMYSSQINNAEERLALLGLTSGISSHAKVDTSLIKLCFEVLSQTITSSSNGFIESLHEQFERGKDLSAKQFSILATSTLEAAAGRPDEEMLKMRLKDFVRDTKKPLPENPITKQVLDLLSNVTEWRASVQKGKRVFDDKAFYESLVAQYEKRNVLSDKQFAALKRLVSVYRDKIPDYEERVKSLGIDIPTRGRGKPPKSE